MSDGAYCEKLTNKIGGVALYHDNFESANFDGRELACHVR